MEERDDYPIIPQPLDDKQRIEKAAIKYVIEATGYQVLPEHEYWKEAFIAGANLKEKELASLKEENALLKECFELSEQAKNHLRTKGYGWTGLDILKTCELVPFSDNK